MTLNPSLPAEISVIFTDSVSLNAGDGFIQQS